jgi:hypothetical protein
VLAGFELRELETNGAETVGEVRQCSGQEVEARGGGGGGLTAGVGDGGPLRRPGGGVGGPLRRPGAGHGGGGRGGDGGDREAIGAHGT